MTDDPFLYNDQLQSSGNPTVGWNDVPVLLQRDIFEQLGFFRGVGFRRVCKSWKSLLDKGFRILLVDGLLVDELLHTMASCIMSFRRDLANKQSQIYCQGILREAYKKARVIVIKFTRTDFSSDICDAKSHLFFSPFSVDDYWTERTVNFSVAIGTDGNLKHLIVTGGRMSADSYCELLKSLRLDTTQRLPKFSLVNCSMILTMGHVLRSYSFGTKEQPFPEVYAEASIPEWSVQVLQNEEDLYRQWLLLFKELIFPFSSSQITWLQNCLQALHTQQGYRAVSPDCSSFSECCTAVKPYCSETIESNSSLIEDCMTLTWLIIDFGSLQEALPFLIRLISTGKLDFPLPPEPVRFCPVHTWTTICSCQPAIKNVDESLK